MPKSKAIVDRAAFLASKQRSSNRYTFSRLLTPEPMDRRRYLLGRRLKKARIAAKLSQGEAGKLLGQDQTFISKLESSVRYAEFLDIENLAALYNKPLEFFSTKSTRAKRNKKKQIDHSRRRMR